jgi:hypothetical protein
MAALDVARSTAPAARPYAESFAMAIASASLSNGITASTGPKISSAAIVMSLRTSAKTVACTK